MTSVIDIPSFVIADSEIRSSPLLQQLPRIVNSFTLVAPTFLTEYPPNFDEGRSYAKMKRKLSLSELGCATSHLQIYKTMVASKIDLALVFEDDALIRTDSELVFKRIVNDLKNSEKLLGEWPRIFSLYTESANIIGASDISNFRFVDTPSQTVCYVLNLPAARQLLDSNINLDYVADWPKIPGLTFYLCEKNLIEHGSKEQHNSMIEKSRSVERPTKFHKLKTAFEISTFRHYRKHKKYFSDFRSYVLVIMWPMGRWQILRFGGRRTNEWSNGVVCANKLNLLSRLLAMRRKSINSYRSPRII
jgi:glycosyl transferase family 25